MRKSFVLIITLLCVALLTACTSGDKKTVDNTKKDSTKISDAIKFKEDYESLNGVETSKEGVYYRELDLDKDNPFVYTTLEDINEKIDNKESFIVYFGANWCPWCRSILPTAIKEAKSAGIDKIYYIDVRPDNDEKNDIRDIYSLDEKKEIYLSHEGTDAYHKFIKTADSILSEYSSHGVDVKGTKYEGAKRVGAPNFIKVEKGKPIVKITGISEKQTDPYMDLTDKILADMSKLFSEFYEDFTE